MFKKVFVLLCSSLVFLSFLLVSPAKAISQECEIDYNRPTIAAGLIHTIGIKEDGTVVAVGDNSFGQLNVSSWTNIKAIAAGDLHTVGIKEDGTVEVG